MPDIYEAIRDFLQQEVLLGHLLGDPDDYITVGFVEDLADFIVAQIPEEE